MFKTLFIVSFLNVVPCMAHSLPFSHIGCYSNPGNEQMHAQEYQDLTPDICYEHCEDFDTTHMLLSDGNLCSCSSHIGDELLWEDGCDTPCNGQRDTTCGGHNKFDIFELSRPDPPIYEPEYMDCYSDCKDDRVMDQFVIIEGMTIESCRKHCLGVPGSAYYATQYSNECFCGKSTIFKEYDRHGKGVCHMPCEGDSMVSCGGFNSFDLFKLEECDCDEDSPKKRNNDSRGKQDFESGDSGDSSDSSDSRTPEFELETPEPVNTPRPSEPVNTPEPVKPEPVKPEPVKPEPETPEPVKSEPETPEPVKPDPVKPEPETPETPKTPETPETPEPKTDEFSTDILNSHNDARCKHGADPLKYSSTVAESAQSYADKLASTSCGKLKHSTSDERLGYGENLYLCGSSGGDCYTSEKAMHGWYVEEINDGPVTTWQGHATQILWKSTTELGCGLSSCTGAYTYDILVCQYSPAGNYMAKVEQEVGKLQSCN